MHLCTDDNTYLAYWLEEYAEFIDEGRLDLGPSHLLESRNSAQPQGHFGRPTSVKAALIDFKVLSNCYEFIGTSGSTVTYVVEWLNKQSDMVFQQTEAIGDWPLPSFPTRDFRTNCSDMLKAAAKHMTNPSTYNISNEQANVLDYLADHNLEQLYQAILKGFRTEKKDKIPSSVFVKNHILAGPLVARMNRDKFYEVAGSGPKTNWFKSLINYKMQVYIMQKHSGGPNIKMDDDHNVCLIQKEVSSPIKQTTSSTAGASSSKLGQTSKSKPPTPPWKQSSKRKFPY